MKQRASIYGLTLAAAMIAVACGGGGSSSIGGGNDSPGNSISGTAATGAAIAGGIVSAVCVNGSGTTTTNAAGSYSLNLADFTLPCLIKVSNPATGENLYSVVDTENTVVNITPITHLVVANALGTDPAIAFANFTSSMAANLSAAKLAAAKALVKAAIKSALPDADIGADDPMKTPFKAAQGDGEGDVHDQKIDALMAALAASGKKLSNLSAYMQTAATSAEGESSIASVVGAAATGMSGCPWARSGMYALVVSTGGVGTENIEFKNGIIESLAGTFVYQTRSFVASTTERCRFTTIPQSDSDSLTSFRFTQSGLAFVYYTDAVSIQTPNGPSMARPSQPNKIGIAMPLRTIDLPSMVGDWSVIGLYSEIVTTRPTANSLLESPLSVSGGGSGGVLAGTAYSIRTPVRMNLNLAEAGSNAQLTQTVTNCIGNLEICRNSNSYITSINQDASMNSFSHTGGSKYFYYRSPNGQEIMLIYGSPLSSSQNGSGFSIGMRQATATSLPTANTTYDHLDSVITAGTSTISFFESISTVTANSLANNSYTRFRSDGNRVDTIYLDTPGRGLFTRPAGADPVGMPALIGMMGKGWSVTTTANTDISAGPVFFGMSIKQ